MPETELERRPTAAEESVDDPQPLAALLAADVVAVHLDPKEGEPGLEVSILDEAAPDEVRAQCVDLRTFLRERLGALAREEREAIVELLDEVAAAEPGSGDPVGLATSRALTREALREPLPSATVDRDEPQGLHFDSVLALSESSFYVRGWARDGQAALVRLTAISPEGSRIELLPGIHREPRPDVDDFYQDPVRKGDEGTGFLGYCESRAPSMLSSGWVLEMENALGVAREVSGPEVSRDLSAARTVVLSDLHKERRWDTALMDHVVPAIETIQRRLEAEAEIEAVWQFGEPPQEAETSIIVPLYGRIDFLEHQLAQFVHDPELREADLIYVLDSPELAESLEQAAGQLFELYGLPFRVAVLARNGGYSVANNRGASLARGRLLLLLNSDVLPDEPGWLSRLAAFYDEHKEAGAVGPKLLFEDDTLQHAGLKFQRPPGNGAWENEHYFKGLHRDLPAANVARRVPAVSGACLMIARELFEELGGLRGTYVQGDYEDTDLCLRLREGGHETWYCPEVELYHLEGQSYALGTRQAMSRFNTWLHTRLWDAEIESLMSELR
ncbi:MAG: glycosyltransferase family 2 protein [Actinobacteria bacterium]|nr:MAG: glycosyltransferase family 2 protein [Actinomycetota bacterium]